MFDDFFDIDLNPEFCKTVTLKQRRGKLTKDITVIFTRHDTIVPNTQIQRLVTMEYAVEAILPDGFAEEDYMVIEGTMYSMQHIKKDYNTGISYIGLTKVS